MTTQDMQQLLEKMAEYHSFVSRRFDEISMEINATSQQLDMTEENIATRFSDIVGVLHSIIHTAEDGAITAPNAGVELENVVDMTENAANKILDAAGRINGFLSNEATNWDDQNMRELAIESIHEQVEEIFMACSFQDLTSQRIRETLNNLRSIEERLNNTLDKLGIHIEPDESSVNKVAAQSQDDIDALFSDARTGTNS